MRQVVLDRQKPELIFASERENYSLQPEVVRSRDRGRTWEHLPISDQDPQTFVAAISSDPVDSEALYAVAADDGLLVGYEFLVSRDAGDSWSRAPIPLQCSDPTQVAIDPFVPTRIFVSATNLGPGPFCPESCANFRSDDAGESWHCISVDGPSRNLGKVVPSPFEPEALLGFSGHRIYRSTNQGDDWVLVADLLDSGVEATVGIRDLEWANRTTAYASTNGAGIFASHDAGLTWAPVTPSPQEPDRPWLGEIVVDPFHGEVVYALARETAIFDAPQQVLLSIDEGHSWQALSDGLPDSSLSDLVIDPVTPNRLYVSAEGSGIFAHDVQIPSECDSGASALCLAASRFRVETLWRDFLGRTGVASAQALSGDSGTFSFYDGANLELFAKVLDGQAINGRFWTYFGALTNNEFSLLITDTATGAQHGYFNPLSRFASVGDIESFPQEVSLQSPSSPVMPESRLIAKYEGPTAPAHACAPSSTRLCLQLERFAVTAAWTDFEGQSGVGYTIPMTPDTGSFWFFGDGIHELAVKVIDGREANDAFWVYYASLSNVEFDLTVTDSVTGEIWTRHNPSGTFASGGDILAFPQE